MVFKRKYRGGLRIAPIREAIVAARQADDPDAMGQAVAAARKNGFVQLATDALVQMDVMTRTVRCGECGLPGWDGWCGPRGCASCKERWRAEKRVSRCGTIKRKVPRVQQAQHRRLAVCDRARPRSSNGSWPWRLVEKTKKMPGGMKSYEWKRYHHVLQRSWEHLRGQLPDMNRRDKWTEVEVELHGKLVRDELARRKGAMAV